MLNLIGPRLAKLRRARSIPQSELANHLGVSASALSHWETGRRPFPESRLDSAAKFLGVSSEALHHPEDRSQRSAGRVSRLRPLYPLGATIDQVSRLGAHARHVVTATRESLDEASWGLLINEFPRDSREELLAALKMSQSNARLMLSAPAHWHCPLHVMHDLDSSVGDHLLQPAIVRRTNQDIIVVFSQVWLNVLNFGPVRVDFLVYYRQEGHRGHFLVVEIDDKTSHEKRVLRDEERDKALPVPTLRYENSYVHKPWFMEELLRDIRALAPRMRRLRAIHRRRSRERQQQREAWAASRRATWDDDAMGLR